ncbi:recombinase family protein [[Ruminococcus] torques]|uniref:recombinase family protein n=1 Tax=[Ruminococcus] torques TaxID=33039 RepID=UPI003AEFF2B8
MEYGYIRVSAKDQNEDRQFEAMKEANIDINCIYIDRQSGKDFNREQYKLLVGRSGHAPVLRKGDLLTILSIDRLGRNYTEVMNEWQYITRKIKADIRVIDMPLLDTRKSGGDLDNRFVADLVLQILSYVAEKERENIRHRQQQGIDAMEATCKKVDRVTPDKDGNIKQKYISRKTGKAVGRPEAEYPAEWETVYRAWKAKEITAVQAMEKLALKKSTFYNLVKRYEA